MLFPEKLKVSELASILKLEWLGEDVTLSGLNEIHMIQTGELVFVDHPKYYQKALNSAASCILINKSVEIPKGKAIIISQEPFSDFNRLIDYFKPQEKVISPISKQAQIGRNVTVSAGAVIGPSVIIGNNSYVGPNVVLMNEVVVGEGVFIHAGSVIGGNAFYYKNRGSKHERLESCGRVIIGNNVEIGTNCSIDRGVTGDTVIGEGTIIDNLVQIGHDTAIGKMCLIAAQVGIAGCVKIGNGVKIWGQVGIKSDVSIADNVELLAQSGIGNDLLTEGKYFGSPADSARQKFREIHFIKSLMNNSNG